MFLYLSSAPVFLYLSSELIHDKQRCLWGPMNPVFPPHLHAFSFIARSALFSLQRARCYKPQRSNLSKSHMENSSGINFLGTMNIARGGIRGGEKREERTEEVYSIIIGVFRPRLNTHAGASGTCKESMMHWCTNASWSKNRGSKKRKWSKTRKLNENWREI